MQTSQIGLLILTVPFAAMLVAGCSRESTRDDNTFVTAKVTRLVDEQGQPNRSTIQMSKPEEVRDLASFFPDRCSFSLASLRKGKANK